MTVQEKTEMTEETKMIEEIRTEVTETARIRTETAATIATRKIADRGQDREIVVEVS
jgi:hypothetical protein